MKNWIKSLVQKYKRYKSVAREAELTERINEDIVIRNDENNKDNRLYIFVYDVPVMEIKDLKDVKRLEEIKKMYARRLNNQVIAS